MNDPNDGQGEVVYVSKLKTQTFKQLQLERLLKSGAVIPASKLPESKVMELQRIRDFEASVEDEERYRRSATAAPEDRLRNQSLTRERFKE